jgi:hypothetical protein
VYEQVHVALLVVKGNCLCAREVGSNSEQLFGGLLGGFITHWGEAVGNRDGDGIVFLHLVVGDLEQGAQHGRLQGGASADALKRVESAADLFNTKDILAFLLNDGDASGLAHHFHRVYLLLLKAYIQ